MELKISKNEKYNCSECGHSWRDHDGADFTDGEMWSNTICSNKKCAPHQEKGFFGGAHFGNSSCWWFIDKKGNMIDIIEIEND
ncbi:MAG: hypothetical protein R3321_00515 [Nitrososphaeraceae archaeon]|nr:hypothetical protein [Nitrososphaeraceae archaeon]